MIKSRLLIGAAAAAAMVGFAAMPAGAGEVTGNGKPTPVASYRAASICSFSGLEDGESLDFSTNPPTLIYVDGGPGVTQTPHGEPAAGVTYPPGVAGQACRGNR